MPDHPIFTVGGTVQAGGGIYLPRPADDELLDHCLAGDFCYVLTARQMGKSSLMVRTAERLREQERRAVIIDLTRLGTNLQAEQWYLGLIDEIVEQLDLEIDYRAWWQKHAHLGATQRLSRFLREELLAALVEPLVIFIDEIDTTLSLPFSDDFFAAIRACYNARSTDPAYKRLSFVLLGVATPGDLIRDPQRTPFNIGSRIDLTDFTLEQALPLAEGFTNHQLPITNSELLKLVLDWTGGHPYLTQRLCRALLERNQTEWNETSIAEVVSQTFFGEKSKQDTNLQFVRDMLTLRAPERYKLTILQLLCDIHKGRKIKDEEQAIPKMHLKLAGIVRREGDHLVLRNQIYARVFDQNWLSANWPVSWKRRALAVAAVGLALLIGFLISNVYNQQIASPKENADSYISVLLQEPPVEPEAAMAAAKELESIAQIARQENILMKLIWGQALDELASYERESQQLLTDYYQRRFGWLEKDFSSPDPSRLRILTLHEMVTLGEGLNRQGQIDRTHALLKTQAPENLRLIWSSLEDIQAQSSRIETIFNALYPKSQYDMQAPRVLAFLAEGTLRVNRPDLAEQALTSLRAMSKYENDDNMQPIPAGSFEMGADPEVILAECQKYYDSCEIGNYQDEAPMHTVTLNTFEMGVYEVTNAEYQQCVLSGVCVPPNEVNLQVLDNYFDENNANYPVINVNWYDASIYCVWRGMRLPSEAEWEYAARGGRESQLYPWGNALDNYLANFCDKNCAFSWAFTGIDDGFSTIAQVGSYQPNAFNLFDMSGNVSEWVSDYYEDQYYQSLPPEIQNPIGPLVGETRVLRGGSWLNTAEFLMVSIRTDFKPDNYFDNVGFRCAKSRD